MAARTPTVEEYLEALDHRHKDAVVALRDAILAYDEAITERVKWNAPSFCIDGEDRVTFRLRPGDRLELIFHRGARSRDGDGVTVDDPLGLLDRAAPDRGVLRLADAADAAARRDAVVELVGRWMAATRPGRGA